jgi:hypothetical protein
VVKRGGIRFDPFLLHLRRPDPPFDLAAKCPTLSDDGHPTSGDRTTIKSHHLAAFKCVQNQTNP